MAPHIIFIVCAEHVTNHEIHTCPRTLQLTYTRAVSCGGRAADCVGLHSAGKTMARYNVREGWMSEELKRERETSSLNLEELTNFLDGNETMTERRRKICEGEEEEEVE